MTNLLQELVHDDNIPISDVKIPNPVWYQESAKVIPLISVLNKNYLKQKSAQLSDKSWHISIAFKNFDFFVDDVLKYETKHKNYKSNEAD